MMTKIDLLSPSLRWRISRPTGWMKVPSQALLIE
jgi:hypothetical protein